MGDHWQDQAACKGRHEMFEITERESNFRQDITDHKVRDRVIKSHNLKKLQAAVQVCKGCPVRRECSLSVEGEDELWTVRGGKAPKMFRSRSRGLPPKNVAVSDYIAGKICAHGHEGEYREKGDGSVYCSECRRIADRIRLNRNPRAEPNNLPGACSKGHIDRMGKRSDGRTYCRECNRITRQAARDREKADTMPS